jgi:hypothetical protein
MKKKTITRIIKEGCSFLERAQMRDGGFESFSSPSAEKFSETKNYRSTFPVALILSCLNEAANNPQAEKIKARAANFLLAQKSEHWSFNYWARDAKEAIAMPYPDDLDDTFCAISALHAHDQKSVGAAALAKIIPLLTFTEEKEGGPYRTWLVPPDAKNAWTDIDLAVNSNIAYFLSLQEVDLPEIVGLVEKAIDAENYSSPYYPSSYPIIYFISRFYTGEKMEKLRDFLFQKQEKNGTFGNSLNTALSLSALLRLGADHKKLAKSVEYLLRNQKNGVWEAGAFCLDPAINGQAYYAGSQALTTAFCVEALALHEKAAAQKIAREAADKKTKALREKIIRQAKKKFSLLHTNLQKEAAVRLRKTLLGDKDGSIVLLPYFFAASLGKNGAEISEETIISLGLANLYGWIAYTIYDDFLDEEGDPKLLSLANVCLRELTGIFLKFAQKNERLEEIFTQIMDKLDSANAWEIANCRTKHTRVIPEYGNFARLAERSLGHALGPLAILCSLGYKNKSSEMKHAKKFFENYLIARQLNDDAHDWEEDIHMGHINAVCAKLIRHLGKKTLPENFTEEEILSMRNIFWNETIDDIAEQIFDFGKSARKALRKMESVQDASLFEKLLRPIENSAKQALKEKAQTLTFLKSYQSAE